MKKIRLTIIASQPTWHTDKLVAAGKRMDIEVEVRDIKSLNGLNQLIEKLGDVVLWRSSSLDLLLSRSVFLQRLAKKRVLINKTIGFNPLIPYKFYQQKMINPLKTITGIPTYYFKSVVGLKKGVERGFLKYPFVMKKNLSARGAGVYKISSIDEVNKVDENTKDYVFQNYVKNDGDFRVLVLGGVALGIIKRVKGKDEFRNNISLGGVAQDMKDLPEAEDLKNKAVSIASKFGLQFCGVDFIYDQEEKIYRFMEVNTVPQWQGFETATGVRVADHIIQYIECLSQSGSLTMKLRNYYDSYLTVLPNTVSFHYCSRLWLWSGDKKARMGLERLRGWYLGEKNFQKRIAELTNTSEKENPTTERKVTYQKYRNLLLMNNLLFWWWMAKTIYQKDVSDEIEKLISKEQIVKLYFDLVANEEDVWALSSAAVNFLYLVELYMDRKVNSNYWITMVANKISNLKDRDSIKRAFYFLSHIVIGESKFYVNRELNKTGVCLEAVQMMEKMIKGNYFKISLDMKFEFLVSCRLVGYWSRFEQIIMGEAERSVSDVGNFLVDSCNLWRHGFGHKVGRAEHRNVLYVMVLTKR